MDKITTINGNGQPITRDLPLLIIREKFVNDVALKHIEDNTGLVFESVGWAYKAQPQNAAQITALFMTYNFKTRYYDNWDFKNTLMLKNDHHVGFDVDSICFDCCEYNNINTNGLTKDNRLSA